MLKWRIHHTATIRWFKQSMAILVIEWLNEWMSEWNMCNMFSPPQSERPFVPQFSSSHFHLSPDGEWWSCNMYISTRNFNHIQYYIFFLIFSNNHKNEIVTASTNLHNLFKIIIKNICFLFLHHILLYFVSKQCLCSSDWTFGGKKKCQEIHNFYDFSIILCLLHASSLICSY